MALFGNLSPEECVVKQSAVAAEMESFGGPARVFESESDALEALREKSVNEGPKGSPGMPETHAVTMNLSTSGYKKVAMVTDGRFSGASSGPSIGHVPPEAADHGPIVSVQDGDMISIDIGKRTIQLNLTDKKIKGRPARTRS